MNVTEYYGGINRTSTGFPDDSTTSADVSNKFHNPLMCLSKKALYNYLGNTVLAFALVISIFGALGNGAVIWLLGFRIKRNSFITYILNLAVADFGLLVSLPFIILTWWLHNYPSASVISYVFQFLFLSMYNTSQFLLTAISIDRCAAIFFPLWYQYHRPPHLSTIVCALAWALSFLLTSITYILIFTKDTKDTKEITIDQFSQFLVNAAVCLPLITIATGALFLKIFLKAKLHQRRKLLIIILLSLLFFLLFAFPYNVIYILYIYKHVPLCVLQCAYGLCSLNSSVNPVVYALVGREKNAKHIQTMKTILQKVFKEQEGSTADTEVETQ